MRYKALLFDLDNTLLDFTAAEHTAVRQAFCAFGLRTDDEAVALYSTVNDRYWQAHERGEITTATVCVERFRSFMAETDQTADCVALDQLYKGLLGMQHPLMPGCVQTLQALKEKGYPLYAVTNGLAVNQHRRMDESGLNDFLEQAFISEEVGANKPDEAFWETVRRSLDLPYNQLLLIGDSMTSDILGARRVGMDACWMALPGKQRLYETAYTITTLPELLLFL